MDSLDGSASGGRDKPRPQPRHLRVRDENAGGEVKISGIVKRETGNALRRETGNVNRESESQKRATRNGPLLGDLTAEQLIAFEEAVAARFNAGLIRAPVHLHHGNEAALIEVFGRVRPEDWVLCSWRS